LNKLRGIPIKYKQKQLDLDKIRAPATISYNFTGYVPGQYIHEFGGYVARLPGVADGEDGSNDLRASIVVLSMKT